MKTISPAGLHELLSTRPSLTLIDVRTPVEFDELHALQAKNIPLDELDPEKLGLVKEQPVYLLCRTGQRATRAAHKFLAAGYAEPIVVEGGTLAWVDANLPAARGTVKVISLERQVRIVAGGIVFIGVLLAQFVDHRFIWLSGFVGGGLVFAGLSDFCGMGLLLAKMPWNKRRPV